MHTKKVARFLSGPNRPKEAQFRRLSRSCMLSNLEGFPGEASPLIGTWQVEIQVTGSTSKVYSYTYSLDEGCLSSQRDPELASNAMVAADESLALLVGSKVSVGTIRRHAALVNDDSIPNSSELLPVKCCLDDPLDSEFLGYNVSNISWCCCVTKVDSSPIPYLPTIVRP